MGGDGRMEDYEEKKKERIREGIERARSREEDMKERKKREEMGG